MSVQLYNDTASIKLVRGSDVYNIDRGCDLRIYGSQLHITTAGGKEIHVVEYSEVTTPVTANIEALRVAVEAWKEDTVSVTVDTSGLAKAGEVVEVNSTSTALNDGQTFTGTYVDVVAYPSVVVAARSDQNCIVYVDFSPDGINTDSTLSYQMNANVNEVHRITVTRKYFRVRVTNNSGSNQTFLRVQSLKGNYQTLTNSLTSQIQADADTIVVRPLDFNLMVAENLYQNRENFIKDGYTPVMTTGVVTQDLWTEAGAYTGFVTSPSAAELVVAGADTGIVYYAYLASDTDLDYTFGAISITGAGTYPLGHDIWRCNFMFFTSTVSTTAFNVGKMTIRHTATPANIFTTIEIGRSQSYCAAYTVPYNSQIFIDRWTGAVRGGSTGSSDGFIWYRDYNASPRLRFPFELQFGSLYFDDVDYLIRVPSRTDIMPRIINNSANNLVAKFTYRLIKVK